MQVFTPFQVAEKAGNKYLGVLVAAKFARYVNEFFPREGTSFEDKKLTTLSLEQLTGGQLTYRLVKLRRQDT
ncbi:MAG: DNA-directed RNA polymerase subunit omega [Gemmatimonadetes bacterium]|nr:DNA-directed RNA polymerase subunit omega [Gemmatimonadota bacterium]